MENIKLQNFQGSLVQVKTDNNIDLAGFLSKCGSKTSKLFIMSHGRGGSFYSGYSSFLPYLIPAVHNAGFDFLGVADRGSEFYRLYDVFEECVADYNSWIEFSEKLGYENIVLGSHSYGPIKITYFYNEIKPKTVKGLFYLAPTDTYGIWKNYVGEKSKHFLEVAQNMVTSEEGKTLMPNDAYYNPISAQSYLSLYGENSKIHIFDFQDRDFSFDILKSIDIPVLTILGGDDKNPLDASSEIKINILENILKKQTTKIIGGANHVFLEKGNELMENLNNWLEQF